MAKYIVKRILLAILTIFIVSVITFFAMNLIPGGPFNTEKAMSPAVIAALNERYGLDDPVPVQYVNYMKRLLTELDFGVCLKTGRDVWVTITTGLKVSARLGLSAAALALVCGVVLGSIAALNRGKNHRPAGGLFHHPGHLGCPASSGHPAAAGLLLHPRGWCPPGRRRTKLCPAGDLPGHVPHGLHHPADQDQPCWTPLGQDYVRTARAKGVMPYKVIFKHALRNALIPVITYAGPMVAYIITGSMVVETIFSIGGLGSSFVTSINNRDYTLIMGVTLFLAFLMVTANLITDIIYKLVDPRISFD